MNIRSTYILVRVTLLLRGIALDDSTAQEFFKTVTLHSYCLEMNGSQWLLVTAGEINKNTISMVSCDVKAR